MIFFLNISTAKSLAFGSALFHYRTAFLELQAKLHFPITKADMRGMEQTCRFALQESVQVTQDC